MTTRQEPLPDLTALLWEANGAWRAIEHGRTGVQPEFDPVRETQRLADAWQARTEFARRLIPDQP